MIDVGDGGNVASHRFGDAGWGCQEMPGQFFSSSAIRSRARTPNCSSSSSFSANRRASGFRERLKHTFDEAGRCIRQITKLPRDERPYVFEFAYTVIFSPSHYMLSA